MYSLGVNKRWVEGIKLWMYGVGAHQLDLVSFY
jgi:hypothetical protein